MPSKHLVQRTKERWKWEGVPTFHKSPHNQPISDDRHRGHKANAEGRKTTRRKASFFESPLQRMRAVFLLVPGFQGWGLQQATVRCQQPESV